MQLRVRHVHALILDTFIVTLKKNTFIQVYSAVGHLNETLIYLKLLTHRPSLRGAPSRPQPEALLAGPVGAGGGPPPRFAAAHEPLAVGSTAKFMLLALPCVTLHVLS